MGFALAIPSFVGLCVFVRCPRIEEGDSVSVDNADGKFNVRAVNPRSVH